jgi:hypothetical protein
MEDNPLSGDEFEKLMASHRQECRRIAIEMLGLPSEQEPREEDALLPDIVQSA